MRPLSWLSFACLLAVSSSNLAADKSTPPQRLAFARRAAERYRFDADGLGPGVILSIRIPSSAGTTRSRTKMTRAFLFVWSEGPAGPPVAAAQFFLQPPHWWQHEFQSMSSFPFRVKVDEANSAWEWQPDRAGITFETVENVEGANASAVLRLRQMRTIAERYFGATDPSRNNRPNPHELRLLTTPVYRYSSERQGIIDGAMFVYAQGTNPEVLALIELVKTASGEEWRRGFGPMSSYKLSMREGDKTVFEQPLQPVPTRDLNSTYHYRWHAEIDASGAIEIPADTQN
jgi:hypothetical protein